MKKQFIVLFVVCILALAMPAHISAEQSTKISVMYKLPTIDVQVSGSATAGELIINPYRLPVTVDGKVQSTAEIVSTPWSIKNKSNVAIRLDAKASAQVAEGSVIELSDRSVKSDRSGDKLLFLFLDCKVTDPGVSLSDLNWDETSFNSKIHLTITEYEEERENLMTLAAANKNGSVADGGVGAFHIAGNAAPKPDVAWNSSVDKVTINIVFTFHPTELKK